MAHNLRLRPGIQELIWGEFTGHIPSRYPRYTDYIVELLAADLACHQATGRGMVSLIERGEVALPFETTKAPYRFGSESSPEPFGYDFEFSDEVVGNAEQDALEEGGLEL